LTILLTGVFQLMHCCSRHLFYRDSARRDNAEASIPCAVEW
jgi:hypothetical protein